MRSGLYLALLGVFLLTAALVTRSGILARKNPGRPINSAMREAMNAENPQYTTDEAMLLAKTYGTAHKLPSGLRYIVRAPGKGDATPQLADEVIYNYDLRLLDGTHVRSTYEKGTPAAAKLGSAAITRGEEEALSSMHKGERRTVIVPYWLGFGEKGQPPAIPPKATVIFELELLDWR
jgi:FKBP-type peptidyl-prolyl cis-trans isomerase